MEPEDLQKLQEIGLSEKEARAYIALLALGRGSAASVANHSGLKTPTAYVILKSLLDKGFARRIPRAKKQLFAPETPAIALAAVEARVANFRSIIPSLDSLAKTAGKHKTRTLFFEGMAGMRKAYWYRMDELKNVESVAFFASAEDISPALDRLLVEWSEESVKMNIATRAIVPDSPTLKKWRERDRDLNREVRVIPPSKYSAKSAIEVFPEFVRISMFGDLQCTIIEDPEFARAFRQIFEMSWGSAA
jgi:HTH-type transcriptional regulator, sugar sensing transcriptional regulator